jgi:CRP-like cAMP-binding protein
VSADAASKLERALALRRIAGLDALDPDLLAALAAHAEVRRLAPGERLAPTRELERSLHFVLEGGVAAPGGADRRGPGSALDAGAADAGAAVTVEESLVLALHMDDLTELCEEHFAILLAVVRGLARAALRRSRGAPPPPASPAALPRGAGAGALDLGQRIALLASCPTFAGVPVHALGQLAQAARPLGLRPGERLWSAGEPAGWLVAVVEGVLGAPAGRAELGPGAVAGLLESIAGEPRGYTAEARTRLTALAVDVAAVFDAAEDDSETAADLLAALARSWARSAREAGP